jgi:hypothetical protein
VSILRDHKHRIGWVVIFALACIAEWAAQRVKEWAGSKITAPKPEPPKEPQ